MEYSEFNDIIKNSKNILILSHVNPDGDTLGSMCGLFCAVLENFKKKCDMVVMSKIPDIYLYLPHINEIKHIDNYKTINETNRYFSRSPHNMKFKIMKRFPCYGEVNAYY